MLWTERRQTLDEPALKPYKTVSTPSETEYVINRSRFIGRCFPVKDEQEALAILERIRKQHWDATHNCYAYRLLSGAARYSDDGEPQGTAGLPMLEVLNKRDVFDVLVISTRYFGGILLGAGGLVRAYTRSSSDAVEAAGILHMLPCTGFRLRVEYPYWNGVQTVLNRFGAIERTDYSDAIDCVFRCRSDRADAFKKALCERTEARVSAEAFEEGYYGFTEPEA